MGERGGKFVAPELPAWEWTDAGTTRRNKRKLEPIRFPHPAWVDIDAPGTDEEQRREKKHRCNKAKARRRKFA